MDRMLLLVSRSIHIVCKLILNFFCILMVIDSVYHITIFNCNWEEGEQNDKLGDLTLHQE